MAINKRIVYDFNVAEFTKFHPYEMLPGRNLTFVSRHIMKACNTMIQSGSHYSCLYSVHCSLLHVPCPPGPGWSSSNTRVKNNFNKERNTFQEYIRHLLKHVICNNLCQRITIIIERDSFVIFINN